MIRIARNVSQTQFWKPITPLQGQFSMPVHTLSLQKARSIRFLAL